MPTKTSGQGGVRYPWQKWLMRENSTTLYQGKHFDCLPHSMAQQLRNAAYRHGYSVSIVIHSDSITFKSEPGE